MNWKATYRMCELGATLHIHTKHNGHYTLRNGLQMYGILYDSTWNETLQIAQLEMNTKSVQDAWFFIVSQILYAIYGEGGKDASLISG